MKGPYSVCLLSVWLLVAAECSGQLIEWQQSYGGTGRDILRRLRLTSDSGYLLGGFSRSTPSGSKTSPHYGSNDFWVIRIDSVGNKVWESSFGGTNDDYLYAVGLTCDGGFVVGGTSVSPPSGNKTSPNYGQQDYWVVRLDGAGNKLWENCFGGSGEDILNAVQETPDGGFILGGWSSSPANGNKGLTNFGGADVWIIRLDTNGNKLWEKVYGGTNDENNVVLECTQDGGFIFGATSSSSGSGNKTNLQGGGWIVRLDAEGNKLWEKCVYNGSPTVGAVHETTNGDFIVGGYLSYSCTGSPGSCTDLFVSRLGPAGNLLWQGVHYDWYLNTRVPVVDVREMGSGYILGLGSSLDFYRVLFMDFDEQILWQQGYGAWLGGGLGASTLYAMELTPDNKIVLGGSTRLPPGATNTVSDDYWVIKLAERFALSLHALIPGRGTIQVDPLPGEDGRYEIGTVVNLTALPNPGFRFHSWTGAASGTNLTAQVSMATSREVTARFVPAYSNGPAIGAAPCPVTLSTSGRSWFSTNLQVWNDGGGILTYAITSNVPWLTVASSTGSSFVEINTHSLSFNPGILSNGTWSAVLSIFSTNENLLVQTVPVTLLVNSPFPVVQRELICSSNQANIATSLKQTADGGFILGGYMTSISTSNDVWIIRLNGEGNQLWDKTFGGSAQDQLASIDQTSDGSYVFGGWSNSRPSPTKSSTNFGGADYWIVELDKDGNRRWDVAFGGTSDDFLTKLKVSRAGGYIVGGYSRSSPGGNKTSPAFGSNDFWILRLDANGSKLWERSFGGTGDDKLNAVSETSDGGFILGGGSSSGVGGTKTSTNFGSSDYWLIRLDQNGNELWQRAYGGSGLETIFDVQQTTDGGYLLAGDYQIMKLDSSGNAVWAQSFANLVDAVNSFQEVIGGGYILAGYRGSSAVAIRVDAAGKVVWHTSIGAPAWGAGFYDVVQSRDGGFSLCGFFSAYTANAGGGFGYKRECYIVRFSPEWPYLQPLAATNGQMRFRLRASALGPYAFERSTNLLQWQSWQTNEFTGEVMEIVDPQSIRNLPWFHRARRLP